VSRAAGRLERQIAPRLGDLRDVGRVLPTTAEDQLLLACEDLLRDLGLAREGTGTSGAARGLVVGTPAFLIPVLGIPVLGVPVVEVPVFGASARNRTHGFWSSFCVLTGQSLVPFCELG
jgi:hypothetical protein